MIKAHSESNHSEAMFKGFVSDIEEKPERIAPCLLMHHNQIKEMANEENRLLLDIDIIAKEVKTFSEKYEFVFTSGGVGPTHDDITFEGVAKAFDDTTFLHPEMEQLIRDYFKDVNDAVLKLGQVCYQMIILFFLFY